MKNTNTKMNEDALTLLEKDHVEARDAHDAEGVHRARLSAARRRAKL